MKKLKDIYDDLSSDINLKSEKIRFKINELKEKNNNGFSSLENFYTSLSNKRSIKINSLKNNIDFLKKKTINNDINLKDRKKDFSYFCDIFFKKIKKYKIIFGLRDNKYIFPSKVYYYLLFVVFVCFLSLSDKIIVEKLVTSGYNDLVSIKNTNHNNYNFTINKAKTKFLISKTLFYPFSFIGNEKIQNANNIIDGGLYLTNGLKLGVNLYNDVLQISEKKGGFENIEISNLLLNSKESIFEIHNMLYKSILFYNNIDDLGSDNLNNKLNYAKDNLSLLYSYSDKLVKNYDLIISLLGDKESKKYMILFQNNDEIRPTGGFLGSTAFITLKDAKISNIETNDIYALEWKINKNYIDKEKAPVGLDKITSTFGLRDANYFISYNRSSQKIKEFLSYADIEIDGIIYINQTTVIELLNSIGGFDSKILGKKIDGDNFSLILSTLVEAKVYKKGTLGTPKQILFDIGNEFVEDLKNRGNISDISKILIKDIKSRDIVIFSFDSKENSLLWKFGLNGYFDFNNTLDYNYPVFTSIGGNKTDRYINYKFDKNINKEENSCDYNVELSIYKSHHFSKFEDEEVNNILDDYGVINKNDILNIQGRGDNYSYTRVVIPKNTIVKEKQGQRVIDYDNFKVVELYIKTIKLETSINKIDYKIINDKCSDYTYKFYKQAGIQKYDINFVLDKEELKYRDINTDFILKKDIDF